MSIHESAPCSQILAGCRTARPSAFAKPSTFAKATADKPATPHPGKQTLHRPQPAPPPPAGSGWNVARRLAVR